ncbi:hypothetical protein [Kitasatospora sp. NBC_00458]|uniref:hypothetical protein n=1 Tax=Kitasatospora sp. NBC_00458 TaxID=2903568 RepID=UPI002E17A037
MDPPPAPPKVDPSQVGGTVTGPSSRHAALTGAAAAGVGAAALAGVGAAERPATAPGIVVEARQGMLLRPSGGCGDTGGAADGLAVQDHRAM